MTAKLRTVHVRVNDAATGQPTPVRIRFTDADGRYCPPLGYPSRFATGPNEDVGGKLLLGGKEYAYVPGTCEVPLPPGRISIEIHKGPEYISQILEVPLGVGQLSLRCTIQRWTDMRRERWYSGDTRVHHIAPHAALLEMAAEDLAVANLLVCERRTGSDGSVDSNLFAFSGQRPALESPGHLVVVNTHNTHALLGSLGLLNSHRVIHPLSVAPSDLSDGWTLSDWCDQCHRKGGLVVWTDPQRLGTDSGSSYGEALADLILGQIDAIEVSSAWPLAKYVESYWYPLLDGGFRVPLVGSSGKQSNAEQLGAWRTYARLLPEQDFTFGNWIEAVRAGRTFVTNGPLASLTVNGQDPGSIVDLQSVEESVDISAEARSSVPFDFMEVVLNGQLLKRVEASGSPFSASLHLRTPLPTAGWLAARCLGKGIAAHTSPVYMQIGGRGPPPNRARLAVLESELDQMLRWAKSWPGDIPPERLIANLQSARKAVVQRVD